MVLNRSRYIKDEIKFGVPRTSNLRPLICDNRFWAQRFDPYRDGSWKSGVAAAQCRLRPRVSCAHRLRVKAGRLRQSLREFLVAPSLASEHGQGGSRRAIGRNDLDDAQRAIQSKGDSRRIP